MSAIIFNKKGIGYEYLGNVKGLNKIIAEFGGEKERCYFRGKLYIVCN